MGPQGAGAGAEAEAGVGGGAAQQLSGRHPPKSAGMAHCITCSYAEMHAGCQLHSRCACSGHWAPCSGCMKPAS